MQSVNFTVTIPILIDVFVTPRNESVSSADDTEDDDVAPDDPVDDVFFLSLLHAAAKSSNVNATTTPDRSRTMVPPTARALSHP
jgi:hypothetical protein